MQRIRCECVRPKHYRIVRIDSIDFESKTETVTVLVDHIGTLREASRLEKVAKRAMFQKQLSDLIWDKWNTQYKTA